MNLLSRQTKTARLQKSDSEIVITHTETQTSHRIPITVGSAKPIQLLLSPPIKRAYDKGDIFIPDGMMATIKKTDGSSIQLIPFSEFGAHHLELVTPVAGAKLMQEGQQRVLVRYQKNGESLEGETTIEVGAAQLRDIELRPPTKQNYVEGQTLSQEGMEIKLKWSDREEIVPLDELANYGLEMTPSFGTPLTVSNNKIEIRHTDSGKRKEHTLTVVPISVTGLTANEIKKDYVENNLLNLSNLIVTLHKNNGTQEQVNYADFAKYNLSVNPEHETKLTTANSEIIISHVDSNQTVSIPIQVEKAEDKVTLKLKSGFPEEFNPKGFLVLDILSIVRTVNNADEEIIDFKDFDIKGIKTSHTNSIPLEKDFNLVITDIDSGATLELPVNLYWGIRYLPGDGSGEEVNLNQKYNGEESLSIILPNSDFENSDPTIRPFVAPQGKEFDGWKIEAEKNSKPTDPKIYKEGEEYVVKDKVVFVAQWKDIEKAPEIISPVEPNNSQALPPSQNNPNGNSGDGNDGKGKGNGGDGDGDGDGDENKTDENSSPKPNINTGGEADGNKDGQNTNPPNNSGQTEDGSSTTNNPNPPTNSGDSSQGAGESGAVGVTPDSSSSGSSAPPTSTTKPKENVEDKKVESTDTQTGETNSTTKENQSKDSKKETESANQNPSASTDNAMAEDDAQRQILEQIERQREERQFENQNYSYIGEQPKSEAIPKSVPENPNLMNKTGEETVKNPSSQEQFNLGKLLAELRIGEREYRQLENDVLVTKVMDVPPMIHENRTMLPARVVAELLNINVDFDDASKTAYFRYDGNLIELALGQQRMKINGEEKMLTADVLNVQGRVLMPITDVQRALVDLGLHVDVNWEHFAKEVQVIDKDK